MASRPSEPDYGSAEERPAILVVDDDPELRHVIRWALEEEGWAVETAADGQQALEQACRRRPRLVILDMGLPRLDGNGVAAGLRTVYGDTVPIVVITADGQAVDKARRVGAHAHLSKPFEIDDLCAVVHQALST
jgi:DNA-binding response OmpR family regulator